MAGFDLTALLGGGAEIAVLGLVFAAVLLAVLGLGLARGGRGSLSKRLGAGRNRSFEDTEDASLRFGTGGGSDRLSQMLAPVSRHVVPDDLAEISALRRRLVKAGFLKPSAIGVFYASRIVLAIGLSFGFLVVSPLIAEDLEIEVIMLIASVVGLAGYLAPPFYLDRRTRILQRQYRESFPDALDLLVVCVEAGLGLDAAIERVQRELGAAHRALGQNFIMLSTELRAGRSRQDALRNLAERWGIDEAKSWVTLILQSEELGTSIAEALRVYSEEMRIKRMVTAEEKAMALPVKLSIPLALFVFPVMLIIIMLPIVIRIKEQLLTQ